MRNKFLIFTVSVLVTGLPWLTKGQEDSIKIFSQIARSGITNEWYLPKKALTSLPRWDPFREKVPFSLEQAAATAKEWVNSHKHFELSDIDEIDLVPFHSTDPTFHNIWYYRVFYSSNFFEQSTCIILMDGTVLNPKSTAKPDINESRKRSEGIPNSTRDSTKK